MIFKKKWVSEFNKGRMGIDDIFSLGRFVEATTMSEKIHKIVEDCELEVREITETTERACM